MLQEIESIIKKVEGVDELREGTKETPKRVAKAFGKLFEGYEKKVEKELDEYIERIKNIKWFKVSENINRDDIDKQVNVALEAFGVKASIEYRSIKSAEDWDAARDAAWDAAWGDARDAAWDAAWEAAWDDAWEAAWDAAWEAARDAARGVARGAARGVARGAARDAARGAVDVLALNIESYKDKYAKGNFIHLITLWEAGLYPCGVIDGKFVVYVPEQANEIPQLTGNNVEENYAIV